MVSCREECEPLAGISEAVFFSLGTLVETVKFVDQSDLILRLTEPMSSAVGFYQALPIALDACFDPELFMTLLHVNTDCRRALACVRLPDHCKVSQRCRFCNSCLWDHQSRARYYFRDFGSPNFIFWDPRFYSTIARLDNAELTLAAIEKAKSATYLGDFMLYLLSKSPKTVSLEVVKACLLRIVYLRNSGRQEPTPARKRVFNKWRQVILDNAHPDWRSLFFRRTVDEILELLERGAWSAKDPIKRTAYECPSRLGSKRMKLSINKRRMFF
jgi:hypothetical protein